MMDGGGATISDSGLGYYTVKAGKERELRRRVTGKSAPEWIEQYCRALAGGESL